MELKCLICGVNSNLKDSTDPGEKLAGKEFKKGFTLFCKLLINSSSNQSGGGGEGQIKNGKIKKETAISEDDNLLRLISGEGECEQNIFGGDDEEDDSPPSCCKTCCKSLEEVIRLERVIQDIKLSQLVHVNNLKEALISSKPAEGSNDKQSDKDNNDDDRSRLWKQVRNELINKCFPNVSSVSQVNQNERRTRLSAKRLITGTPSKTPSSTDTSHYPCRQSKLKAYRNLRNLSTQSTSPPEVEEDDQQSRSSPSDNNEDGDDNDPDFIPIKEEPQDIEMEDDNHDPSDFGTETEEAQERPIPKPQKTRSRSRSNFPRQHSHTVYLISSPENLYIYKNTFVKYIPSSRHFHCQEISCPTPIIHQTPTSSSILSIQTHVTSHHSFSSTLSPSPTIILRFCPNCSTSFPCNSFKTERLFTAHLHSCYANKHKILLCSICSKPCLYVDHLMHFWSHKNTQDKIHSIKSNSPIPSQWKFRILSRKPGRSRTKDPFYSLLTNTGGTDITAQDPPPEKMEPPPRPKYTPQSIASRTCPTCQKICRNLKYLRAHQLTHLPSETRPTHQCPHCSKKLMSEQTLKYHIERVHRADEGSSSKDVMIQCAHCPQQFYHRDVSFINAHMKKHEGGNAPFICDMCGKGFWWKRYLDKHRDTHKDNIEDRHKCDKCEKSYKQRRHLLGHRKTAH